MILTIDIGIRNLSMCIVKDNEIKLWDNFNLIDEKYCNSLTKKGNICNKKCSRKLENDFFCKIHFPKEISFIKKKHLFIQKNSKNLLLQEIAKITLEKINEIYQENLNLFLEIKNIFIELQPKINQKMKFISHLIFGKMTELLNHNNIKIRFMSARKKLLFLDKNEKKSYKQRKNKSIEMTMKFIELFENCNYWIEKFKLNKKKDDLADCFLMNYYLKDKK